MPVSYTHLDVYKRQTVPTLHFQWFEYEIESRYHDQKMKSVSMVNDTIGKCNTKIYNMVMHEVR